MTQIQRRVPYLFKIVQCYCFANKNTSLVYIFFEKQTTTSSEFSKINIGHVTS